MAPGAQGRQEPSITYAWPRRHWIVAPRNSHHHHPWSAQLFTPAMPPPSTLPLVLLLLLCCWAQQPIFNPIPMPHPPCQPCSLPESPAAHLPAAQPGAGGQPSLPGRVRPPHAGRWRQPACHDTDSGCEYQYHLLDKVYSYGYSFTTELGTEARRQGAGQSWLWVCLCLSLWCCCGHVHWAHVPG
jgi:hypothetical protein